MALKLDMMFDNPLYWRWFYQKKRGIFSPQFNEVLNPFILNILLFLFE